jgi:4-amino-4-deoxy-L-arabinose transferase-like glycosyltransferase
MKMCKSLAGAGFILLVYLALGLAYNLVVPPFERLDEVEHLGVVRYMTDTGQLPIHGMPAPKDYHYRQEVFQPPLYYLFSVGLVRRLGLQADDASIFWRFNPWRVCGRGAPTWYDNRAVFYHNPNREAWPWQGTLLMLYTLRVGSTLLQAATVAGTFALARLAFPTRFPVALVATAIVAFNSRFLMLASGVNNDNLVIPLATAGLYLILLIWQEGLSVWRAAGLGILIALAGLAKLSGWLLLGLMGLVALALVISAKEGRRRVILMAASIPVVAFSLTSWWFWRNWQIYKDLTALQLMWTLVGSRASPIQPLLNLHELWLLFQSFWGEIPCSFYPTPFYVFYLVLVVLAFVGLIWGWRKLASAERQSAVIFAIWCTILLVSWARWDAITPAPSGRMLFPALPALASLMALGIDQLAAGRFKMLSRITIVLLALLAWWSVVRILPAFFAPPPRYSNASAVQPQYPLNARWEQALGLLGYDVAMDDQGPTLDLTLYWQALAPMTDDYVLSLQLVSPVAGDTTLRWNYNSWPGHGNYPTSAWQPGEVIADRYRLQLPDSDSVTQAWQLQAIFYHPETSERLLVQADEQPIGDALPLTLLRVRGKTPDCPAETATSRPPTLDNAVALTHASVTQQGDELMVTLCWASRRPLAEDYAVFVHLYDNQGALLSVGDGPPMDDAFPTHLWQTGDVVSDRHRLALPPGPSLAQARIGVGLYRLEDGTRLTALQGAERLPNDTIVIWPR